ncbi:hypothetical protein CHLRE_01g050050v5 [Chlamydomonas reinhardtii]|uniref:Protein arginine N-methyltransferase 2 n=1 Tax=Chlamydomonas reinhardtii TaxID=3055 RepID=A0A2K3E803_CHLRE|nr:uncharacterized protein CHLRE_01g050050v5 [Chlamydomonas reinhardtii]PNW88902.1 hypothetical protein CHLRE_01g050050v5 [Chlamydomonas reinhardtii]
MTQGHTAPEAAPSAAEVKSIEEQLLAAAAEGNAEEVSRLIELEADVDFQDEEGVSPLMRAAEGGHTAVMAALLQAGAPWNAQDSSGYCAGEYAMGSGQQEAVDMLLDFAVQAELVLGALHRRMQVGSPSFSAAANSDYLTQKLVYRGEQLLDADGEAVMMGWERPLMLRHAEVICPNAHHKHQEEEAVAAQVVESIEAMAVTEAAKAEAGPSSQAAAAASAAAGSKRRKGGHVVNVGFGLGIVDTAIQTHSPDRHTIIEAHPDVLEHMTRTGWADKPGVRILRGRWQDVLPELLAEAPYDGIFFDTYGEYYEEMREFHMHLPRLLARDGVYSFFNGLASDNIFFHMVYCRLISLELASKGLHTEYTPLAVGELGDEVWQGVRNKYWTFETYFLPEVRHEAQLESVAEGEGEGEEE